MSEINIGDLVSAKTVIYRPTGYPLQRSGIIVDLLHEPTSKNSETCIGIQKVWIIMDFNGEVWNCPEKLWQVWKIKEVGAGAPAS